jgi:hypothetical protein
MPIDLTVTGLIKEIKKDLDATLKKYNDDYIPTRILQEALAEKRCPELELFIASFPDTPSALIEELAASELCEVAAIALAMHQRTSVQTMNQICESPQTSQRIALAANLALSPQAATTLAKDPKALVRAELASNREIPARIRDFLQQDEHPAVRLACLQRFTDEELVRRSCLDEELPVAMKAILTGRLDEGFLASLAHSNDELMQASLLQRKKLGYQVLRPMLFSPHAHIRLEALQKVTLTPADQAGIIHTYPEMRSELIKKGDLHETILNELISTADRKELIQLLEQGLVDQEKQAELAEHADPEIARVLIECSDNDPEIIRTLSRGKREVILVVALYAELNEDQIPTLFSFADRLLVYILTRRGFHCPDLALPIALELIDDPVKSIQAFALGCRELPAKYLQNKLSSPHQLICEQANQHPSLASLQAELANETIEQSTNQENS